MLGALVDVLVIVVLVLANGALAGSEIALVSAGRARLRSRAEGGEKDAAIALALKESPNRFLSTVQIGITAVGITAGAWGATAIADSLAAAYAALGVPEGRAGGAAVLTVVLAIIYLTLVVGELVPKRLALGDPEGFASRVARPMSVLARFADPVVRLLSASTDLVLRLMRWRLALQPTVTEEEIELLVAEATASGILEKTEQEVVRRLFRLSDRTVETLMTPRERIVWLDLRAARAETREGLLNVGHTRFVVCDGELDRVRGYVKVQDLLDQCVRGKGPDLGSVLRQPHVVRPWTPAFRILERFQASGDHIALITGSDGRVLGLVTLNDVLENIVGDFPEPHEMAPPGAVARADGSWLMDGVMPFEEALRVAGREKPEGAEFPTLHAFAVHHLGEWPSAADSFEWQGLRFEVVDMDGSRVDKVLVEPAPHAGT